MRLSDYLSKEGQGARARLARACGLNWASIHHIATGKYQPSLETALAIERATNGEVSTEDLLADYRRIHPKKNGEAAE